MPEYILCPRCQKRLRLPPDIEGGVMRCSSCWEEFPVESAGRSAPEAIELSPRGLPPPRAGRDRGQDPFDRDWDDPESRWESRARRRPQVRQPARSSGSPCLVIALVLGIVAVVGVVGVVGFGFLLYRMRSTSPSPARVEEDPEERQEEVRAAFRDQQPLALEDIAPGLQPMFKELGGALRAADGNQIAAYFDGDRMSDEMIALGTLPLKTSKEKSDFKQGVRRGLGQNLAKTALLVNWTESDIRNVKKLNDDEAVVIVRHKQSNGAMLKMRWWVTRRTRSWKVYDFEDLDTGLRLSTTAAAIGGEGIARLSEVSRATATVSDALRTVILQQDPEGADRKLRLVAGVKLPKQLEALRCLVRGMIRVHQNRFQEAVDAFDEAARFQVDMPIVDFWKGIAFNRMEKWDSALKHLEKYQELLGEDAEVCREMGLALRGLERFNDAARVYRKSLDLDPKDGDTFLGFLRSLGGNDNKDDLAARFLKLDNLRENFDILAADCEEREFPGLLEPIVLAMRRVDPDHPPVDYYLSLVKARTRRPNEAVPLFKSALAKQKEPETRKDYVDHFLRAMASTGKYVEAYSAVPDSREAFRFLAAEAIKRYWNEELSDLIALHRKTHADDPLLPWYQAEVYVREGRYALAEKMFAAALAKPPDEETLKLFRSSRVLARYHIGKGLSAYRDIGPRPDTFLQLADLCFNDEEDTQLQALLDAHAKNDPKSAELLRFRYRLKIRQDQPAEAVALFKASLANPANDQERTDRVAEFLREMASAGKSLEGYKAAPDAKEAFQVLGSAAVGEGRRDDLARLVEVHRAAHAADPMLAYYQGKIHVLDKDWDKAAKVLGEGLKRAQEKQREWYRWEYVRAMYKSGHGLEAYGTTDSRSETFMQLANLLAADKKATELEALIKAHRPHAADDPDLDARQATAKVWLKQPDEAAALVKKAYQKQKDVNVRNGYVSRFVLDMDDAGQPLEGYRLAPDKPSAFRALAPRLVTAKREKELAALLEGHAKEHASDPLFRFHQGEWRLLRGEVKQAEEAFQAALAKATPEEQWRYRNGLFRARVKAGKAAETYREIEPGKATFQSLASVCLDEKNAKQLQALIDAHRRAHPDDVHLPAWGLEVRWLNGDHEGVLQLITEHDDDLFCQPRHQWKADDYRVRALLKLKRTKDAIEAAEAVVKRKGSRVLLVLAHASAGDVKQAIAALGKRKPPPYLVRNCYSDNDLGPILHSEPFKEFREKFPEPKEEPVDDDLDEDD
jgi:uncharacterized protein HemY